MINCKPSIGKNITIFITDKKGVSNRTFLAENNFTLHSKFMLSNHFFLYLTEITNYNVK